MNPELIQYFNSNSKESLQRICEYLERNNHSYTWVGFYLMNHNTRTLHLGPFIGPDTDHVTIPFGKGICGQVADSGTSYLAKSVSEEANYIACSIDVKSELVIPIYHKEKLVAQLDIDSNVPNAFSSEDQLFLEKLCTEIGNKLGQYLILENNADVLHTATGQL